MFGNIRKICSILKWKMADNNQRIDILREKEGIKIGQGCEIYRNVSFGSEPYLINIGNNVRITDGVRFITHDGGVWVLRNSFDLKDGDLFGEINVGDNVHIGMGAIIMPGVHIGDNCVIGAGAIVTKDVPNNSIAVGIPARVLESIEQYYDKHKNDFDYTKQMSYAQKKEYLMKKYEVTI